MLDASVVISKGSGVKGVMLTPSAPDVILDGGSAGATARVGVGGGVETALIDNTYTPTSAWTTVAAGGTQAVAASTRRAFRQSGSQRATLAWTFA